MDEETIAAAKLFGFWRGVEASLRIIAEERADSTETVLGDGGTEFADSGTQI